MLFRALDPVGVDMDAAATQRARDLRSYAALCLADATKGLPFQRDSFDTVFSNSTLEHIPDTNGVLSEISRVLRPGGRLVITVPTRRLTDHLTHLFGASEADWLNERLEHKVLLSDEDWCLQLKRHNLKVEVQHPYMTERIVLWYRWLISLWVVRFPTIQSGIYSVMKRGISEELSKALDVPDGACTLFIARKNSSTDSHAPESL